jgi:RND family efflux transporter MFP subunit
VGISIGVLMVGAFAVWSGLRIQEATREKQELAVQREEDSRRAAEAAKAIPVVSVVTAVPTTWAPQVEIDGTLAASQSAELGFKAPGRIAQLLVKVGDVVKAGQTLATLDSSEASAQLRAAQAQLRAAQAQLALATDTEHRTTSMVQSGSAPEASGVQTSQQRALAAAQLEASQAQIALAQVALANHRLVAPFAGSVTRAPEGVGSVVSPGDRLFEVADLSRLKLKGTLSERDASLVETGATILVDAEGGPVPGTVTAVLGSVDSATRRVRVEAEIDNTNAKLRAGSFVRAKLRSGRALSVLKLPREVLRPGGQDELLVVVNDALASRRVIYSISSEGELLVRHGLSPSERVVLSPKSDAKAGDRVLVQAGPSASAAPVSTPSAKP